MPPLVTVIIPAHNNERYLRAAVEGVRAQTFTDWTAVVVDDGSTDATAAIADSYRDEAQFQVIHQAQAGVSAARNAGLARVSGEYVALLDGDDAWRPEYLSSMVTALQADPGAVAAFAGWQYMDAEGGLLPQTVVLPAEAAGNLADDLLWRNALVPSGALVRRAALEQCGGFDTTLAGREDWDMWLRLLPLGRFVIVPRALVLYRTHADNKSNQIEVMEVNFRRVLEKHLGALPADPAAGNRRQQRALGALNMNSALAYFRQGQLEQAHAKLRAALTAWPAYLDEAEVYYELACAFQPRGRRGQPGEPGLAEGAALLQAVVRDGDAPTATAAQRRLWWGQASLVLARLLPDRRAARHYAAQALRHGDRRVKAAAGRAWLRAALPSGAQQLARRVRPGRPK